jgi:hypothetical protein
MYRRFHQRFGTAGLIVSILALILALTGAAFAASGLTGKQKKEVTKIAKQYAGKPGAQGGQGPAGAQGAAGANGTNGTNGTNGKDGASAEATSFSGAAHGCEAGGVEVKSAKPAAFVCNGKKGEQGEPGPLLETLPKGKTMRGMWSVVVGGVNAEAPSGAGTISFPFALPSSPQAVYVKEEGEHEEECPGSSTEPEAAEGILCIYQIFAFDKPGNFAQAPNTTFGAIPLFIGGEDGGVVGGSWAATAS